MGATITTDLVLGETWTFLRRKAGRNQAMEFQRAAERLTSLLVCRCDELRAHAPTAIKRGASVRRRLFGGRLRRDSDIDRIRPEDYFREGKLV